MQAAEHQALYRQWRPMTFHEVCGQDAITSTLKQAVINQDISHAYLFAGTRGTGKTSLAKIFSRAINCLQPEAGEPCNKCSVCQAILQEQTLDVTEMDAASNNSVDNIRRLIDEVPFLPSLTKYKVYIIDEVHMLSTSAFNALLKTLEEPPQHVVFILATTEINKIPATILSRCQRFNFRRLDNQSILDHLTQIAQSLNIQPEPACLQLITRLADGSMRDAISLLDQAKTAIQADHVLRLSALERLLGKTDSAFVLNCLQALMQNQAVELTRLIESLAQSGLDYGRFLTDLAYDFRQLLLIKLSPSVTAADFPDLNADDFQALKIMSTNLTLSSCLRRIQALNTLINNLHYSFQPRLTLEIGLLSLLDEQKIKQEPARSADTSSAPMPTPTTTPTPVPLTELKSEVAAEENSVEAEANCEPAPRPAQQPTPKPAPQSAAQEVPQPAPKPATQPAQQQVPQPKQQPAQQPATQQVTQPKPQQAPQPAPEQQIKQPPVLQPVQQPEPKQPEQQPLCAPQPLAPDTDTQPEVPPLPVRAEKAADLPVAASPADGPDPDLDLNELSEKLLEALKDAKQAALSLILTYRPLKLQGRKILIPFNDREQNFEQIAGSASAQAALNQALKKVLGATTPYTIEVLGPPKATATTATANDNDAAAPLWLQKLQEYAQAEQLTFQVEEEQTNSPSEW